MNYNKIYKQIIKNRQEHPIVDGYTESHHILPRCLGGNDLPTNIVSLTAREHFVCHYLLTKLHEPKTQEWYKMLHAFIIMNANGYNERYINSRLYEARRKYFSVVMSKSQSGIKNSQHGTRWIYNDTLEKSIKINKNEDIPEGWKKGRVVDFQARKQKNIAEQKLVQEKIKKQSEQEKIKKQEYSKLFDDFKNGSYDSISQFVRNTDFPYSKQILMANWQKYLSLPKVDWGKRFTSQIAKQIIPE